PTARDELCQQYAIDRNDPQLGSGHAGTGQRRRLHARLEWRRLLELRNLRDCRRAQTDINAAQSVLDHRRQRPLYAHSYRYRLHSKFPGAVEWERPGNELYFLNADDGADLGQ